ncbi:PH domain-containing protein [Allomuricauda sp. R78024]|uniref:PH domain-containing protein n=1 Tax=Allomuricauda sp. R78024 TaxID=3093867 RepID=UPI0037C90399
MEKYPSKVSYGLLLFVMVILVGSSIPMLSPPIWLGIGINTFVMVFVLMIFFNLNYIVDGSLLSVKLGFLVIKKIDIHSIKMVAETNSLISAPAVSLDRLEIIYNDHDSVIISPKDKSGFIDHITKVNPEVVIQYKPT